MHAFEKIQYGKKLPLLLLKYNTNIERLTNISDIKKESCNDLNVATWIYTYVIILSFTLKVCALDSMQVMPQ